MNNNFYMLRFQCVYSIALAIFYIIVNIMNSYKSLLELIISYEYILGSFTIV